MVLPIRTTPWLLLCLAVVSAWPLSYSRKKYILLQNRSSDASPVKYRRSPCREALCIPPSGWRHECAEHQAGVRVRRASRPLPPHCRLHPASRLCTLLTVCSAPLFALCVDARAPLWRRSGGLEHLFGNRKHIAIDAPESVATVGDLIQWIRKTLVRERHDMFVQGANIRPGVLVLINDVDWELEDTVRYEVRDGDSFAFISTLHGG